MNKQKILIVDDDQHIAELLSLYLIKEQFETRCIYSGEDVLPTLEEYKPNLILLDLMLPGMDGYQVCTELRKVTDIPVIIISAKGEVFDKVLGLDLGADDYVEKPFDSKEVVARVKTVLRRFSGSNHNTSNDQSKIIHYDALEINLNNYYAIFKNEKIFMPPKEIELLFFLASSPNHVFTRDQLLTNIWGYDYLGDSRTVDVHIKRIREKITGTDIWNVGTVWGVGYKFEVK